MNYMERERGTQQLVSYWIWKWLLGTPAGEGESLSLGLDTGPGGRQAELGDPQQPPDSGLYLDSGQYLEHPEKGAQRVCPTEAK